MDAKKISANFIGIALIISAIIFGSFYYYAQLANTKDVLSVTGSAKTKVTSDQAKLVISLSRTAAISALSLGYSSIANDLSLTKKLLQDSGVDNSTIVESPVSMYQNYYKEGASEASYQLSQTITIQSNDVNKITDISKKIPDLASQGAIVSVQSLEYYYSRLPDLRISLLSDAIKDAKSRAEKIAEGTGRKVGSVQEASSGVVQVLTPNSVDISDYGSYDTSSIEKEVMVTVKASFRLK
jgi:hypothetical protein